MSKLSRLKQEAYQAAKKRDWDSAVTAYKRILELDKNNPTVVNELGDICLKKGDLSSAINNFLTAAAKYRSTGLQNNAVAIYKKILRHDDNNLNAHWYLAEIRAGQGLTVEGERHAHAFLSASENLSTEVKDIYLKRCSQLFILYPESKDVLERLQGVFKLWSLPIEESRVLCLLACVLFDAEEKEEAEQVIASVQENCSEIKGYEEYQAYQKRVNPSAVFEHPADVNSIDLIGDPETVPTSSDFVNFNMGSRENKSTDEAPAPADVGQATGTMVAKQENPGATSADGGSVATPTTTDETKEDVVEIEIESTSSLDEALQEAASAVEEAGPGQHQSDSEAADMVTVDEEPVDLLAEILADADVDLESEAACQLDTIASEIGQQVGGEDAMEDSGRQYEMGMVYLEMGLFDQACECFSTASMDREYALRCYEMWGITLCRQENYDEAVSVLARGLELAVDHPREMLGLLYHTGRAHEAAGHQDDARTWYGKASDISPSFQDVKQRLESLSAV